MESTGTGLLCAVAAAAAAGDAAGVASSVRAAAARGVPESEVRETLRMLHPFIGFPRALDAFAAAGLAGGGAPAGEPGDAEAAGRDAFERVYGPDAPRILARIRGMDEEAARRVIADAYGRVISQPGLPLVVRERIAVVVLAAQGLVNQLGGHVGGALRCGAAAGDIEADLAACAPWIPEPGAARVRAALAAAPRRA
ncbi:MAG: hypothetical protein HMLKMBBP_00329 [Planctomycetes bacterium]|nr:hypothetical protein [Planctomycetota bacterium]